MFFKLTVLVMKSLGRNKVRSFLTALGVIVLVAVFTVVSNVTSTLKAKVSEQKEQTRLIVSERWTAPSRVPVRYIPEIANLDGVTDWTTLNLLTGFLGDDRAKAQRANGIVTRPENVRTMHNGMDQLSDEAVEQFQTRKDAALVGVGLMRSMDWKIGQNFIMKSATFPPIDIQFTIVGTLPGGDWSTAFFCRNDYYMDVSKDRDTVGWLLLKIESDARARELAARIVLDYENRQPAVKVETESASMARFVGRSQAILQIVDAVVWVLLIDMVIIVSNSISIAVRERRVEMAVLKVLGFQPLHIMLMIVCEAMLVGAISGLVGTVAICALSDLTAGGYIPVGGANKFLLQFPVPWSTVFKGVLIGDAVGLIGSILPALGARDVRVSDVFARVA